MTRCFRVVDLRVSIFIFIFSSSMPICNCVPLTLILGSQVFTTQFVWFKHAHPRYLLKMGFLSFWCAAPIVFRFATSLHQRHDNQAREGNDYSTVTARLVYSLSHIS